MGVAKKQGWTADDWYAEGEGQLHFFPRQKRLVWTVGKKIVDEAEAWGGTVPERHRHYPVMRPRPTTPGTYVIYAQGPYTTHTWPWSRIPWGTPLRVDHAGRHVLFQVGGRVDHWQRVQDVIPEASYDLIKSEFHKMYPDGSQHDPDGDYVPDVWIFNDFGPWTIRYFRDPNRNRERDVGEGKMGEMIHTTADNEAQLERGKAAIFEHSHGCIHISPVDRDRFLQEGAFEKGSLVVVHGPSEVIPEILVR